MKRFLKGEDGWRASIDDDYLLASKKVMHDGREGDLVEASEADPYSSDAEVPGQLPRGKFKRLEKLSEGLDRLFSGLSRLTLTMKGCFCYCGGWFFGHYPIRITPSRSQGTLVGNHTNHRTSRRKQLIAKAVTRRRESYLKKTWSSLP